MGYSLRKVEAFVQAAERRKKAELADLGVMNRLATAAKGEVFEKWMEDLMGE